MLPYLILGIALFIGMILAANWYASADSKVVLKVLKWSLIGGICLLAIFFFVSGRLGWAFMALPALLPWFFRIRAVVRAAKAFSRMTGMGANAARGQTSDVETLTLRMSLDHDNGDMSGVVLKGPYGGRRVESMSQSELVELIGLCLTDDDEAVRLLEAYLDRYHPEWRSMGQTGQAGHQEEASASGAGSSGNMGRAEAFRVLGLEDGAGDDKIKDAHRRLIGGLHPDHGGSDYLAAKINEAKEILLKGR